MRNCYSYAGMTKRYRVRSELLLTVLTCFRYFSVLELIKITTSYKCFLCQAVIRLRFHLVSEKFKFLSYHWMKNLATQMKLHPIAIPNISFCISIISRLGFFSRRRLENDHESSKFSSENRITVTVFDQ